MSKLKQVFSWFYNSRIFKPIIFLLIISIIALVGIQSLDISKKTSFFVGESNALIIDTKSVESFITFNSLVCAIPKDKDRFGRLAACGALNSCNSEKVGSQATEVL